MEIIIKNENNAVAKYALNYEDVKNYLATELAKYKNLLVTEEFMQSAKKSRAELNAMKKDLKGRLSEIRQAQLAPYEALKTNYTDKLEQMIDEQLIRIDTAIKEIEKKREEQKTLEITEYFNSKNQEKQLEIPLRQVFNPKWTNATYSMNKVKADIDVFFEKIAEDLKIIESFDDEFIIPLRKLYLSCFDMSVVMRNKVEFDNEKKKRLEAEAEAEKLRNEIEDIKTQQVTTEMRECEIPKENEVEQVTLCQDDIPPLAEIPATANCTENKIERINFWVEVTPEQKLLMRNFVLSNNIKCGKLSKKDIKETAEILKNSLSVAYCYNCDNDGKEEICENCHRKSICWQISTQYANEIAKEIVE